MTGHPVTDGDRRARTRPPTHPGAVIREDMIPALGTSVAALARDLQVSRQTLHGIIREKDPNPITPEMAVRFGRRFGTPATIWLNMQVAYDLWHAERSIDVSDIPAWTAA